MMKSIINCGVDGVTFWDNQQTHYPYNQTIVTQLITVWTILTPEVNIINIYHKSKILYHHHNQTICVLNKQIFWKPTHIHHRKTSMFQSSNNQSSKLQSRYQIKNMNVKQHKQTLISLSSNKLVNIIVTSNMFWSQIV